MSSQEIVKAVITAAIIGGFTSYSTIAVQDTKISAIMEEVADLKREVSALIIQNAKVNVLLDQAADLKGQVKLLEEQVVALRIRGSR